MWRSRRSWKCHVVILEEASPKRGTIIYYITSIGRKADLFLPRGLRTYSLWTNRNRIHGFTSCRHLQTNHKGTFCSHLLDENVLFSFYRVHKKKLLLALFPLRSFHWVNKRKLCLNGFYLMRFFSKQEIMELRISSNKMKFEIPPPTKEKWEKRIRNVPHLEHISSNEMKFAFFLC